MKKMTIDELRKRGLKVGDIYRADFDMLDGEFDGWYLVLENMAVGLNTRRLGAHRLDNSLSNISKIVLTETIKSASPNRISEFLKTFDESLIHSNITYVKDTAKYVHCVHFGSSKLYTWRVPERLNKVDFEVDDIIEVDTFKGKQFVQVRETAEYEYDEKTKEVLSLIRAYGIPF